MSDEDFNNNASEEDDEFDEHALEAAEKARQQKNARARVKQFLERRPAGPIISISLN